MATVSIEDFSLYRVSGLTIAFIVAFVVQVLWPYQYNSLWQVLKNWRINVPLGLFNAGLVALICGDCLAQAAAGKGVLQFVALPFWGEIIFSVLFLDFVSYLWHRLNHTWPFLWRFHAAHHADSVIDSTTAIRFHPGEALMGLGVRLGAVVLAGIPLTGLLVFEVIYQLFNFFEHGSVRLPQKLDRALQMVVITPDLHRTHHSIYREQADSNYGTIFSVWDRLFQSFHSRPQKERIPNGLPGYARDNFGLLRTFLVPLKEGGRRLL